jgi:hypothetical protein
MATDKAQLLVDLQVQGKRICSVCNTEVTDPDNMKVDAFPINGVIAVYVCHLTCP